MLSVYACMLLPDPWLWHEAEIRLAHEHHLLQSLKKQKNACAVTLNATR